MVGVAQGDGAHAVLLGERDGALHGRVGVQVAGAAMAVPALEHRRSANAFGPAVHVHLAVGDHLGEAREAVQAMGVNAVAGGLGEEPGAERGALPGEAEAQCGAVEGGFKVGEGNAQRGHCLSRSRLGRAWAQSGTRRCGLLSQLQCRSEGSGGSLAEEPSRKMNPMTKE